MRTISIQKKNITKIKADAIVNAANEGLWAGSGVCGAIFKEAGLLRMTQACRQIGGCETGSAVVTPAFDLPAKIVIHAVGPMWKDGQHEEPELLFSAYSKALKLAVKNDCQSIAFPLISSGIFGYPKEQAWEVAFTACMSFFRNNPDVEMEIVFAVLEDSMVAMGEKILSTFH